MLVTSSLFREFNLTEENIIDIYDRYDTFEDIQTIIDNDPENLTNTSETIQQFYQAMQIMVETGNDISPIYPIFQKLKKENKWLPISTSQHQTTKNLFMTLSTIKHALTEKHNVLHYSILT